MNDYITSNIRTLVPAWVSFGITWLALNFGIVVDSDTGASLAAGLTSLVFTIYYAVVRYLESKNAAVGILLGTKAAPTYNKEEA